MTIGKTAFAAAMMLAQAPTLATTLVDGGFEAKGAALPVTAYCYDNSPAGNGFCKASPWVNLGSNSGVIKSGDGSWGAVIADEGIYYGFIQVAGVLAQSFTATANGTGTAGWVDHSRGGYGPLNYDVSLFDGVTSLALGSFSTTQNWVARTSATFALTSGTTYQLRFKGLSQTDVTALIDRVALTTTDVPEPANWVMLIAGFGLIGAAMRRRRTIIA